MKPSDIGELEKTHRKEARRRVLHWWPDRNESVPGRRDAWWGRASSRERFGGART